MLTAELLAIENHQIPINNQMDKLIEVTYSHGVEHHTAMKMKEL